MWSSAQLRCAVGSRIPIFMGDLDPSLDPFSASCFSLRRFLDHSGYSYSEFYSGFNDFDTVPHSFFGTCSHVGRRGLASNPLIFFWLVDISTIRHSNRCRYLSNNHLLTIGAQIDENELEADEANCCSREVKPE